MSNKYNENYKKEVLSFALFLGEIMMANGAETHRVEETITMVCKSRGFRHINVFTSPTTLIISDERFDGLTFMKTIKNRSIDLNKIVLFNDFSRKFVSNKDMSIRDAKAELRKINNSAFTYPSITNYIGTGIGSGCFAFLIGGDTVMNILLTIFASSIGFFTYRRVNKYTSIPVFASLIAAIIVAVLGLIFTNIQLIDSPTTLIVGSIMPLLAGVSFVKGIRDLISGELISGVARIFEACMTSITVAVGVGVILELWMKMGGTL